MWYDDLPAGKSWAALWTGYVRCGNCPGIRPSAGACPVCGNPEYSYGGDMPENDGREVTIKGVPGEHAATIVVNKRAMRVAGGAATGCQIKAAAMAQGIHVLPNFVLMEELERAKGTLYASSNLS
jgi:hypothetical protein